MTAEVIGLRGVVGENDRKALLLQAVSASFDLYVTDWGEEPDAIVYVLGELKQTCRPGWQISGASEGGATSMQSVAAMSLLRDIIAPDQDA